MKQIIIILGVLLLFSCITETTIEPEEELNGDVFTWMTTFIDGETETVACVYNGKIVYACTPNDVYPVVSNAKPVAKNMAMKAYELYIVNDTLFALTQKIVENGKTYAVNGEYFLHKEAGIEQWKKDEDGKYKTLKKQIGLAKNSKGVPYRIKHNTETIGETTYILPSEIEKFIDNKWVKFKIPEIVKYNFTNIFIAPNDYIFITAVAGSFDSNNHFQRSETGPAFVIFTVDDH